MSPMGSPFPPMPGGGAPPPPATPPAGVSGLIGSGPVGALPQTGPSPQQQTQGYMDQIKQLHMTINALAQDHPEAAEELNIAKNALTQSMGKVATAVNQASNQPSPPTF